MKTRYEKNAVAKKHSQNRQQMTLVLIILAVNSSLLPLWVTMGAFAVVMLFAAISFVAAVIGRRAALTQTAARMKAAVALNSRIVERARETQPIL